MHVSNISFPSELIAKIVRCVEDAVGDDIREDIHRNNLQTRNSVPSRIWDLLNTNVIRTLDTEECLISKVHRGPWEMLIVLEKTTQCVFTFMREKRFAEIRKSKHRRPHMHYVDILARQFNADLPSDQQMCFLPHTFADEDLLSELVQALLHDFEDDVDLVRNHVLVLFEASGYQLTHIRAVMVTPSLEIAHGSEQDWSRFISANESVVVDKVVTPGIPENQPDRGLKLKAKAIARQKNKPKQKEQQRETREHG